MQLRIELAIHKELGRPFEEAWEAAYEKVRWPEGKQPRQEWQKVTVEMKDIWRDCYEDTGLEIEMDRLVSIMAA